ncbi:BMP family ABC transporter substrate-binding protein [Metamycoplasma auris]|uniref:Basic membrane lipoprotein Med (Substrate-binding protein (PBP1-ABC) superfamily) n=1 Tax=Metamycoplasma auris TaxID=51363 RepID=A0A2W7G455_9BACT|nr:BMP family ABC transporter substrate-binding protein [Metamycoplasma auris]PZV99850.1 basic membrane lipoprotein Med (substrate-binding protein (PBP1-ABC) superfamily) [Metamycoplasma auris]
MKKLLWGLSVLSSVVTLPLIAASCGKGKYAHPKGPKVPVADVKLNDEYKLTEEEAKNFPYKMVMITDGGDINDKSFNQSPWEGILHFADLQNKLPLDKYGVIEVKNEKFDESYNNALNAGYNIWVLPGFHHKETIKAWIAKHKEEVKKNKIIFIGQDFTNDNKNGDNGFSIFQEFKTKEAAFAAGYATAEFLSNEEKKEDRTFGTFGGGTFPAVTDFNEGFMKGVWYWNNKNKVKNKNTYSVSNTIDLSSGFDVDTKMESVVKKVISLNPKVILPVAGPAAGVVLQNIVGSNRYMIGVDADQGFAAKPNEKHLIFTSIVKSLGQAAYDAVAQISKVKDTSKLKSSLGEFEFGKTDGKMYQGYDKNWVDITKTHITDPKKKELADKALEAGKEAFKSLDETHKNWLASSKMVLPTENTENSSIGLQELLNKLAVELYIKK